MSENINSMWFDNIDDVLELVKYLLKGTNSYYNDVRIIPEDTDAYVVEWVQLPWNREWGGKFSYVDENQTVMTEEVFPDNHTEYCLDEEDYKERLDEFLKDNPGWVKTSYGTWTNTIENEKFLNELHKQEFTDECESCKVPDDEEGN